MTEETRFIPDLKDPKALKPLLPFLADGTLMAGVPDHRVPDPVPAAWSRSQPPLTASTRQRITRGIGSGEGSGLQDLGGERGVEAAARGEAGSSPRRVVGGSVCVCVFFFFRRVHFVWEQGESVMHVALTFKLFEVWDR